MTEATTEIVGILRKHDLAGTFMLVDPERITHYTKLDASWSCATYDGEEVRIKALANMFPNRAAQEKCVNETIGMVMGLIDCLRILQENFQKVAETISKKFTINHRTMEE